ncbi:MAG: CHAT domain-containing protein, partial [Ardenticatenales bacterium]|nr:CHAT domain-containing protein [Ardenticatenales bacterium]
MTDFPNTPIKLLFVSARPHGSEHIRFQEEHERIKRLLPAPFEVIPVRAASIKELYEAFSEHHPHLFHFAGHGDAREGALLLEGPAGEMEPLVPEALGRLFQTLRAHYSAPYAIFLNACHSQAAAAASAPHVGLVIGMTDALADDAALALATAFYHALPRGSWQGAFEMGRLALPLADLEIPGLLAWEDVPEAPWLGRSVPEAVPAGYQGPVPRARRLMPAARATLVDLLADRYISAPQREALLYEAFYHADPRLHQRLDRAGSPRDFALCLVQV